MKGKFIKKSYGETRNLFVAPFWVEKDNEYLPRLKAILNELVESDTLQEYSVYFKSEVSDYIENLINLVEEYYLGRVVKAISLAKERIVPFLDNNEFAITDPEKSIEIGTNGV